MKNSPSANEFVGSEIAVIGMAGRFPGSRNLDEFWQNLRDGRESVTFFTDEELAAAGVSAEVLELPNYIKAGAILDDTDLFDAAFFGYNPREAEVMDPQHRIFLECSWEALEHAGYDSQRDCGLVGVYAGAGPPNYLLSTFARSELLDSVETYYSIIGNDKDYLATRVSYKLNLKGPSLTVQSACSTSLVAVHQACQSLLNEECDMALAGAVSVMMTEKRGYLYEADTLWSPDGHVRAFDARAQGTLFGEGVGVVVLKRLTDALAAGDSIQAVIRGSAVNNDGTLKVAFTAPSLSGQAEVITEALANAGVEADTISYIEAHGTGTALGDPIEVAALTQVFGANLERNGGIPIGSVKTNIGHPNTAAGMAGLLKTILALKHREIPPSLHFEQPNPRINFGASPFYVNTQLTSWPTNSTPRRAGVSSFGMGGTNAHMVLEEAPAAESGSRSRPWQLLLLSAKSPGALSAATTNLAEHLRGSAGRESLADVAYTLQVGRRGFSHRRAVVARDADDAVAALDALDPARVVSGLQERLDSPVVFMFPGGGAQYPGMARELYEVEPTFRQEFDRCAKLFKAHLELDLLQLLYSGSPETVDARRTRADFESPASPVHCRICVGETADVLGNTAASNDRTQSRRIRCSMFIRRAYTGRCCCAGSAQGTLIRGFASRCNADRASF